MWWQLTSVLSGVIAACYLSVAITIARGLRRTGQGHSSVPVVLGALLRGQSPCADASTDRRRAVEINDDVIQGLTTVLYALELDDPLTARAAAQQALTASRTIVSQLVGSDSDRVQMGPGDLRREQPAPAATRS